MLLSIALPFFLQRVHLKVESDELEEIVSSGRLLAALFCEEESDDDSSSGSRRGKAVESECKKAQTSLEGVAAEAEAFE